MADDEKKKPAGRKRASTRKSGAKKSAAGAGTGAKKSAAGAKKSTAGAKKAGATKAAGASAGAKAPGNEAKDMATRIDRFGEAKDIHHLVDKLWRLVAMVLFGFLGSWVYLAITVLAAVQFVVVLFADRPSKEIQKYAGLCGAYVRHVLDFLSYETEQLPYPFGPLPGKK